MATKFKAAFLCAALFFCGAAAFAQDQQDADYKQMMEQAIKSGNYGQSQAENWDARLKCLSGTVMVKPSESEEWSKITGIIPLDPGDSVKTGSDGIGEIYLDDKGAISVGRNTQLEMTSLDQGAAVFTLKITIEVVLLCAYACRHAIAPSPIAIKSFFVPYQIGWPSLFILILFCTGIILLVIGIVGLYIGKIFEQVKNRPLYLILEEVESDNK